MVKFKRSPGKVYVYPSAPSSVLDEMLESESIGSYFQTQVRGKFDHLAIDMDEDDAGAE